MLPGNPGKSRRAGFDFTENMKRLIEDIIKTHPAFSHIDPGNILVAISPSNGNRDGVVAKLRPMRFEGGSKTKIIRGIGFSVPGVYFNGNEVLYIIYFHLPRFLNHGNHTDKLGTVLHELYHISPAFNGDVRRFSGKNYAHGNSRKSYDELISKYTDEYLKSTYRPELCAFLKYRYSELKRKYGAVSGDMIRVPRLKPVPA